MRNALRFIFQALVCGALLGTAAASVCGDGLVTDPEQCDDNNLDNGDGCSSTCQIESGWDCYNPVNKISVQRSICFVYPCTGTCTLSRNYWQAFNINATDIGHDIAWPTKCADTVDVPAEENLWYGNNITWLEILNYPTTYDACIIAGRQIVAGRLNVCLGNCLDKTAIDASVCLSDLFVQWCSPLGLDIGGNLTQQNARSQALNYSSIINKYNNGDIGPGRCVDNLCGERFDYDLRSKNLQKPSTPRPPANISPQACDIVPLINCTHVFQNGTCLSFWGYVNNQPNFLFIPVNNVSLTLNYFTPGMESDGQAVFFEPGIYTDSFVNYRDCEAVPVLSWILGNSIASSVAEQSCPVGCDGLPFSPIQFDECGVCGGSAFGVDTTDCNNNHLWDFCEIDFNPSLDCNQNGVLDSCEDVMDVYPILECTFRAPNNTCVAYWSYNNTGNNTYDIPLSSCTIDGNFLAPSGFDDGQIPTHFVPGYSSFVFTSARDCVDVPYQTWTVANDTATSGPDTTCPVGCDGIPFSQVSLDLCGVCGGPSVDIPLVDCDSNMQIDYCEILQDPSLDCNSNGIKDVCDNSYAIVPATDCAFDFGNSTCVVFWSYTSYESNPFVIDAGSSCPKFFNYISPLGTGDGVPTVFYPGFVQFSFITYWNCTEFSDVAWILANTSANTIDASLCPVGCDNIPYSTKALDACGICGGNVTVLDTTDCDSNSLYDVCEIALDPSLDSSPQDGILDICQNIGSCCFNGNSCSDGLTYVSCNLDGGLFAENVTCASRVDCVATSTQQPSTSTSGTGTGTDPSTSTTPTFQDIATTGTAPNNVKGSPDSPTNSQKLAIALGVGIPLTLLGLIPCLCIGYWFFTSGERERLKRYVSSRPSSRKLD